MAMTRLSDPTPRMTLPRALLSEALRLARSPLALMPLMSAIVCGLAVDEERSAGRLANLTAVPSRGRAVAAKLLALAALGAVALAVAAAAVLLAWFCRFEDGRADE